MSQEEFDKTGFTGNMRCLYKGKEYSILGVSFDEKLIGINEFNQELTDDMQLDWKRCENIQLI